MKLSIATPEASLLKPPAGRRGAEGPLGFPAGFLTEGVTVEDDRQAEIPSARRRAVSELSLSTETAPGEGAVLVVRHPSGALTFHGGEPVDGSGKGRRAAQGPRGLQFRVAIGPDEEEEEAGAARRGEGRRWLGRTILLKVTGWVADAVLPTLARKFEEARWRKAGIPEGWLRVTPETLKSGRLEAGQPGGAGGRSLLLLHGTFSHASNAFGDLSAGDFFAGVRDLYGNRLFAFNHFTLSKTPQENARELLRALPEGPTEFDVITHSRGGLVLRELVEGRDALGAMADRFRLGHAVLVASPNGGTPLITPDRWDRAMSWFATMFETLQTLGGGGPVSGLGLVGEWIAEAIKWLAARASQGIPGLHSMVMDGEPIRRLQGPPSPDPAVYSALVANFQPDRSWWKKMLDVGMDRFFQGAHDLVVPSEGGWKVDGGGPQIIPAGRIGCFGAGGNLPTQGNSEIMHTNIFQEPAAVEFILRALARTPQGLSEVDPETVLPFRGRRGGAVLPAGAPRVKPAPQEAPPPAIPVPAPARGEAPFRVERVPDEFQILILRADADKDDPDAEHTLLATYGGARIALPFSTKGVKHGAGARMQAIIRMQRRLRDYIDGVGEATLPTERELIDLGSHLFETLFPGDVRRLYDIARSRMDGRCLNVIFTSQVPWVSDLPWEYSHDPSAGTFLAMEEVHFVRNVVTFTPGDFTPPRRGPLRILVVAAQPIGAGELSVDEEIQQLRFGFEGLIDSGLVTVEVLPRATLETFHGKISAGRFDILHFIGHGEFDSKEGMGSLIFEGEGNAARRADEGVLRKLLCGRGLRLAFLNACESGQGRGREGGDPGRPSSRIDFTQGVAPALLAHGLPAVVANQFKVLDVSATEFARRFYWSLASGLTLGQAAREARIAVDYSLKGEVIDWAVPVLYALNPTTRLCEPDGAGTRPLTAFSTFKARREGPARLKVAVWDVEGSFPELRKTLIQLSRAQDCFDFQQVSVSAPVCTWRIHTESHRSIPSLDAEEVARRLDAKARALECDYLVCLTQRTLVWVDKKQGRVMDEFVWWPDTADHGTITDRVLLFAMGLFKPEPRGPETERLIANALVISLAGAFAGEQSHEEGPSDCPLSWNVDPESSKGLVFDEKCRGGLLRALARSGRRPECAEALERLLK